MTTIDQAALLLKLPAGDYFVFDDERKGALQSALVGLTDASTAPDGDGESVPEPLLAIGAPDAVDLDARTTVPVLIGTVQSGQRRWQVNPLTNVYLWVRDLESGALQVSTPLLKERRGEKQAPSGKGVPPDELNAATTITAVDLVDLRQQLESLEPGRHVVTAVDYDLRSSTLALRLTSGTPRPEPAWAAPHAYVQSEADVREEVPEVVRIPATAAPSGPIEARVEMQVGLGSGVLRSPVDGPDAEWHWVCHFVLLQLDERPVIVAARAAVQPIGDAVRPTRFNAVFTVDLHAGARSPLGVGAALVYLEAGDRVLGPYPLDVTG